MQTVGIVFRLITFQHGHVTDWAAREKLVNGRANERVQQSCALSFLVFFPLFGLRVLLFNYFINIACWLRESDSRRLNKSTNQFRMALRALIESALNDKALLEPIKTWRMGFEAALRFTNARRSRSRIHVPRRSRNYSAPRWWFRVNDIIRSNICLRRFSICLFCTLLLFALVRKCIKRNMHNIMGD